MRGKNKQKKKIAFIIFILVCVGVGFAALGTTITTIGNASIKSNSWQVYVSDVTIDAGSVNADVEPVVPEGSKDTVELEYDVTLDKPGDYYQFDFTVKNDGTIDIMLEDNPEISGLDDETKRAITHTVTTSSGATVRKGQEIKAGESQTYRVKVSFETELEASDLPSSLKDLLLNLVMHFVVSNGKGGVGGAEDLILKASPNPAGTSYSSSTAKGEMFAFTHAEGETVQMPNAHTEYRYIGNTPNNYIDYNNETWRIIGVFPTDDGHGNIENRIKILKDEFSDSNYYGTTNDFVGGYLDLKLNLNAKNKFYYNLTPAAKEQAGSAVYYLGGVDTWVIPGDQLYIAERGTDVYGDAHTNTTRKFAVMYPSDYLYTFANGVNNICFSNTHDGGTNDCSSNGPGDPTKSWMHKQGYGHFTITPASTTYYSVTEIAYGGNGVIFARVMNANGVRPVTYLKSSVQLSGTGKSNDHYKITKW